MHSGGVRFPGRVGSSSLASWWAVGGAYDSREWGSTPSFKDASGILSFPNLNQVCGGKQVPTPSLNPEQWSSNFSVPWGHLGGC